MSPLLERVLELLNWHGVLNSFESLLNILSLLLNLLLTSRRNFNSKCIDGFVDSISGLNVAKEQGDSKVLHILSLFVLKNIFNNY